MLACSIVLVIKCSLLLARIYPTVASALASEPQLQNIISSSLQLISLDIVDFVSSTNFFDLS